MSPSRILLCLAIVAVVICTASASFGQKENNVWCFGEFGGVDFNTDPPTVFRGPFSTTEGSASISHRSTGALLFSTDGTGVWNTDGRRMPNGFDLVGGYGTSTQAATIIPFPSDTNRYYVVTCDQGGYMGASRGVNYSIVDMRLDGGRGDVVQKNIPLVADSMTEKCTAIPHENGCDVWVLIHHSSTNEYYSFLISDTLAPVRMATSSLGHNPRQPPGTRQATIGVIVASRSGQKLAYASSDGIVELLDFDRSTGQLSNVRTIYSGIDHPYGLCFSPDESKLYVGFEVPGGLVQYDLSLPEHEISANAAVLAHGISYGAIRPGPDGQLYVSLWQLPSLGVIHRPNEWGPLCDFEHQGLFLAPGTNTTLGLPAVLDAFLDNGFECPDGGCGSDIINRYCESDAIEFSLSPQPADSRLRITSSHSLQGASIQLTDLQGRSVVSTVTDLVASVPLALDVSHCVRGMYTLLIRSNITTRQYKVLIGE